jgi:signal transduction histidine kinase
LKVEAPDSGVVMADPTLTRRILDNLVENAIRHSPAHGTVWLRGREDGGSWILEVADEGLGVPPAERTKIFDRFARADNARTRTELGGTGLGLAVSETLAKVQAAELILADGASRGAVFQLRFPPAGNGQQPQ